MTELVFITGASSGIGQALALRYYRDGARLALVARRTAEVERWAAEQNLDAARFKVYGADVADLDSMARIGRECIAAQGLPDVVIANAGISIGMDTTHFDDLEVMRRTFETNNVGLAATFHPFVALIKRICLIAGNKAHRFHALLVAQVGVDNRPCLIRGHHTEHRVALRRGVKVSAERVGDVHCIAGSQQWYDHSGSCVDIWPNDVMHPVSQELLRPCDSALRARPRKY